MTITDDPASATVRPRDADNTRQLLLAAARRHFAQDGYSATTVRDIATEAGVNVALINRYFESKEGLFEACLASAKDLGHPSTEDASGPRLVRALVEQVADAPNGEQALQLMLLLRTSGDERADAIRRATLESFATRMAAITGQADDADLVLRAQVALSAVLGIVLVRSSIAPEPLASAGLDDLSGPLGDALSTLLMP